jgi:6-pyruvoyl-tetrahydropterin synthase
VRYWDKKSAKKLMAYLDKNYALDQDFKLKYNSPSYIAFAKILYQIMYQFGNKDIQNSLTIEQQIERIKSDIFPPMQEAILLYHFFRPSVPLVVMESAYNTDAIKQVDARVYYTAKEAFNRKANRKTAKEVPSINWLFGFDVDVVLNAFFAKQEIKKPSVVVFWTTFGSAMEYEYYHLNKLYQQYGTHLNFIYVCVNAFEQEQKAKAIVSREQLNGHHLFPKNADAYWKSEWKDRKISSLPFYVLVDTEQQLVDAIGIPLDHAALLNSRINSLLFK